MVGIFLLISIVDFWKELMNPIFTNEVDNYKIVTLNKVINDCIRKEDWLVCPYLHLEILFTIAAVRPIV